MPYNNIASSRITAALSASPTPIPAAVSPSPRASTIQSTSARCAPMASRTPISRVRCATL